MTGFIAEGRPIHNEMPLSRYLVIMGISTSIAAASWVMVIIFLDPTSNGPVGLTLFFLSFFLMIFGIASIVGYTVRRFFQRHEIAFRLVAVSFRQAVLVAMLLTVSLFLQSKRLFTVWTSLALLAFLTLLEAFFVARSSTGRHAQNGGLNGA